MTDQEARYAIYYVPAVELDLYRFGSAILEYDCYTGECPRLPRELGAAAETWRRLTHEPRRYGFHATLKAPFHLSPSCTESQLASALSSFAGLSHHVAGLDLAVRMLGGFVAVVPREPSPLVVELANQCTTLFDAFRAPMSARERTRRVAGGLSQSQMTNLERWGYPFLFADFRFHMTLTGKVPGDGRDEALGVLRGTFERMCLEPSVAIDRLALMKQEDEAAHFRVIAQVDLAQRI